MDIALPFYVVGVRFDYPRRKIFFSFFLVVLLFVLFFVCLFVCFLTYHFLIDLNIPIDYCESITSAHV